MVRARHLNRAYTPHKTTRCTGPTCFRHKIITCKTRPLLAFRAPDFYECHDYYSHFKHECRAILSETYSNIRNEFSQCYCLIPDRVKWRIARQVAVPYRGVHLSRSRANMSIVAARIERDCKFISGRRDFQRTYAQLFLLFAYFFSRRGSALPFCSQVDQLSLYAMLLLFFFRRFYRVLRWEGVPFGKMFVLRASVLESCMSTDVDAADGKWVMEFYYSFFLVALIVWTVLYYQ